MDIHSVFNEQTKELERLKYIFANVLNKELNLHQDIEYPKDYYELSIIENNIIETINIIRCEWLNMASNKDTEVWKSPEFNQVIQTAVGNTLSYGYERALHPDFLESNWSKECEYIILFKSCMSSIDALLKTLISSKKNITIICWCSYFETMSLFKLYKAIGIEIILFETQESMFKYLEKNEVDLIFIEPIKYNKNMETISLKKLMNLINNQKKIIHLIFDTTLTSHFFLSKFLQTTIIDEKLLIYETRSGLKLDQQGFEFSNVGILKIYHNSSFQEIQKKIIDSLKSIRVLSGTGLSFYEVNLLDFGHFKDCKLNNDYQYRLLNNNMSFYSKLESGNNIKKIFYPHIDSDFNKAPFIFIILKNSDLYNDLLNYIKCEFQKYNVHLKIGNSFGFRDLRVEIIEMINNNNKTKVFKIACGSFKGLSFELLIKILNDFNEKNINADGFEKH